MGRGSGGKGGKGGKGGDKGARVAFRTALMSFRDSPLPVITKSRSTSSLDKPSRLDAILSKGSEKYSAARCFGLAGPYRNNPSYDPDPPPPTIRGDARFGPAVLHPLALPSPLRPVPLARSPSDAWADSGDNREFQRSVEGAPDAFAAKNVWQCEGCGERDPAFLEPGPDTALACVKCGLQATGVTAVSQERASNCPKEQANDQVGEVQLRTAAQAQFEAWSNGPESRDDRRRRETFHQGGTRMPTKRLMQQGLLQAQNCIDTQAQRDAREALREDGPDHGRRLAIIRKAESIFDEIPSLDDRIARHIRMEAIRIYSLSMRHEEVCGSCDDCPFRLSQTSVVIIAHAITELVLASLLDSATEPVAPSSPMTTIASLAPERTRQDVLRMMKDFKEFTVRFNRGMPRMQVLSTVSMISEWEDGEEYCTGCAAHRGERFLSASLCLSRSVTDSPAEFGKSATADPGDCTLKLRNALFAAAKCSTTRTDVRLAAFDQLVHPTVLQFVEASGLPVELLAVCLLTATALRMGQPNPAQSLTSSLRKTNQISASTTEQFINELAPLLEVPTLPSQAPQPQKEATGRFCT